MVKTQRSSNLELFRVFVMLLIISHHYVINSGLTQPIYENLMSNRSLFLLVFGAWGKTGINCFVLITGYFMCKKQLTFERVAKLLLEVYFYRIVIYVIFSIAGYTTFSFSYLFWLLIPVKVVTNDFVSCYLVFLLFIPFLNILIQAMTEKMHILLIVLTVGIYTVMGTISSFKVTMNYVSWFIVLYFLAAYIRCYPKKVFSNCKLWGILTVVAVAISVISILLCARLYWESSGKSPYYPYYFLSDSNKLFALIVAMCSFLFFLNLPVKTNRFINVLGKNNFWCFDDSCEQRYNA